MHLALAGLVPLLSAIEKSAIDSQKTYQSELSRTMHTYIQEHQSKFIPAGLDPAAVPVAKQDPSSSSPAKADAASGAKGEGADDAAPKAREQDRDRRGLQWAYDTLEGTMSVPRRSASCAIELLRDAWESQFSSTPSSSTSATPSTSAVLYVTIVVLVLSNLWALMLVGKQDGR